MKPLNEKSSKAIFMIGAGGHAKVAFDVLRLMGGKVSSIINPDLMLPGAFLDIPVITEHRFDHEFSPTIAQLINGVGFIPGYFSRLEIFLKYKELGYDFVNLVHPTAWVSESVKINEGVQIMAGCMVQTDCYIGANVIINTKSSIDHDCVIGEHSHIAPGVTLSGGVFIGKNVFLGVGSAVSHGVSIGDFSVVGAGQAVTKDLPKRSIVRGR